MNRKAAILVKLINSSIPGPAVEIGSIRKATEDFEEGFSTVYLARECKKTWRKFISVEIEERTAAMANAVLKSFQLPECVQCANGNQVLLELPPIAFLYLDSSRFPEDTLCQLINATLLPGATVAIDDAHKFDGHEWGKAQFVVDHLKSLNMPFDMNYTCASGNETYRMVHFIVPNGKKAGELPSCSSQRAHPV